MTKRSTGTFPHEADLVWYYQDSDGRTQGLGIAGQNIDAERGESFLLPAESRWGTLLFAGELGNTDRDAASREAWIRERIERLGRVDQRTLALAYTPGRVKDRTTLRQDIASAAERAWGELAALVVALGPDEAATALALAETRRNKTPLEVERDTILARIKAPPGRPRRPRRPDVFWSDVAKELHLSGARDMLKEMHDRGLIDLDIGDPAERPVDVRAGYQRDVKGYASALVAWRVEVAKHHAKYAADNAAALAAANKAVATKAARHAIAEETVRAKAERVRGASMAATLKRRAVTRLEAAQAAYTLIAGPEPRNARKEREREFARGFSP